MSNVRNVIKWNNTTFIQFHTLWENIFWRRIIKVFDLRWQVYILIGWPHILCTMTLHISSDFSRNHLFADNLMKTISLCYRLLHSRLSRFEWITIWSKVILLVLFGTNLNWRFLNNIRKFFEYDWSMIEFSFLLDFEI